MKANKTKGQDYELETFKAIWELTRSYRQQKNSDDYKFGLKRFYTTIETKSTVVADTISGFEFTPFVKTVWI